MMMKPALLTTSFCYLRCKDNSNRPPRAKGGKLVCCCPQSGRLSAAFASHLNGEWKSMLNEPLSCYGVKVNPRLFVCAFLQRKTCFTVFVSRSFNCTVCGRGFKRKYHLERHMLSHSDFKPFTCELCGQGYKRKEKLDRHSLKHGNMSFACPSCPHLMNSQQELHRHMVLHMKQEPGAVTFARAVAGAPPLGSSTPSTSKEDRISLLPFTCDVCDKVFTKRDHLTRHKNTHTDIRAFKCHVCDLTFKRKDKLTSHLKMHGPINVPCNLCGKSFHHQQSLLIHMRKAHVTQADSAAVKEEIQRVIASGKSFVCEFCFCGFTRKYHLDRHRAASHGGLKPHLCPECGQGFTRKDHMERHLLTHLGLKPFSCTHFGCDKSFRRKESLSVHLATHESDGKPPFPCVYCDRRFATPKSRAAHMQKHVDGVRSVMEIVVDEH